MSFILIMSLASLNDKTKTIMLITVQHHQVWPERDSLLRLFYFLAIARLHMMQGYT